MKRKELLLVGALALGLGAIGGRISSRVGLEDRIKEVCRETLPAPEIRLTIPPNHSPLTPTSPSLTFKPEEHTEGYLASKVGFKYNYTVKGENDKTGTALDYLDYFGRNNPRSEYEYTIERFVGINERLMISSYEQHEWIAVSRIHIEYANGNIESVSLHDNKHGTQINLRRNRDMVTFDPAFVDETTARALFESYSSQFFQFKQKHRIDELIAQYRAKMEVTQTLQP